MNNQKPLIIDKNNKVCSLYTYCGKCKRLIENRICSKTGKRLSTCKNTDQHGFKAIISIPGTDSKKRRTRIFNTRDLNEAIRLKLEFEEELKANDFQSTDKHIAIAEAKPNLMIECMAFYIGFLNNEGVEAHMVKTRSKKHLWEVNNFFAKFCKCLKSNGINHTTLKIEQINDKIVALFHTYILEELNHSNKTYNKMMALFRQYTDWLIEKKGYEISNPFKNVQRRIENSNKTIVTSKEFEELLNSIKPESGIKTFPSGERKNLFRTWLKDGFRLALETGLRREEFMSLKFSDIVHNENGKPQFIVVENFKVNRIKGESVSKEKKYVPITKGLMTLLLSIDYDIYKDTEEYLIGREEKSTRKTLIDLISKSFSHYWKQTKIEKTVQLKHLRKTYLTALVGHFGDKAPMISNHSGIEVLKKHYVNDQQLVAASNNFSVFEKQA